MSQTMKRYWIVGGEFDDANFERLVEGTERLVGPFRNRIVAERAWRDMATSTRPSCYTRYTIAEEPTGPQQGLKA
jgi:hypothetical protein